MSQNITSKTNKSTQNNTEIPQNRANSNKIEQNHTKAHTEFGIKKLMKYRTNSHKLFQQYHKISQPAKQNRIKVHKITQNQTK